MQGKAFWNEGQSWSACPTLTDTHELLSFVVQEQCGCPTHPTPRLRTAIGPLVFGLAALVVFLIAALTVSFRVIRA